MWVERNALLGTRKRGTRKNREHEGMKKNERSEEDNVFTKEDVHGEVMFNSSGHLLVNRLRILFRKRVFLIVHAP